jgi:hypothetical protein
MNERTSNEKRNIFEKIRNSKLAIGLFLIGGLSSMEWMGRQAEKISLEDPNVSKIADQLKIVVPKTEAQVRVKSQNQYIVHILQVHQYDNSFNDTKQIYDENVEGGFQSLISSQKEIEKILLELSDKNDSKDVFIEGLTTEDINVLDKRIVLFSERSGNDLTDFDKLVTKYEHYKEHREDIEDALRAFFIYAILQSADKILASENLNKDSADFKQMLQKRNEIADNPMIKGDNIYVWGAERKLWIEGKITVKAAEAQSIEDQLKDFKGTGQEEVQQYRDLIVYQRQSAAIQEIINSGEKEKYIPIVFGASHDFKRDVVKTQGFGLVEITTPSVRNAAVR